MSEMTRKQMNGLARMQAILAGEIDLAPVQALIGFELDAVEAGKAVFSLEVQPQHFNPMGTLHGGIVCDLGDAAMGGATITTVEEGESFTTLELKVNFFKPVRDGRLTATARVVRRTRSIAYVECEVIDESGSLVAKLSSTCMVLRGDAAQGR